MAVAEIEDIYPLSPMQQGMLFHSTFGESDGDYINQMQVEVAGLDVARFEAAWNAVLQAHDSLRCVFVWSADQAQPVQVVLREARVPFSELDWRGRDDLAHALPTLAAEERGRGFDVLQAPLLRLVLVRLEDDRHALVYTSHHILMDGWSNAQLLGEVLQRYCGERPAGGGRFGDYIGWLQRQDRAQSEAFWRGNWPHCKRPPAWPAPVSMSVSKATPSTAFLSMRRPPHAWAASPVSARSPSTRCRVPGPCCCSVVSARTACRSAPPWPVDRPSWPVSSSRSACSSIPCR